MNEDASRPPSVPVTASSLDRIHVVLVEPGDSRNVGSVARAMMNLGFRRLHLVAPPRYHVEDAVTTACWAEDLLHAAEIHPTLEAALAPMHHVVGFSARHGKQRPRHLLLDEWTAKLVDQSAGDTALVFGPEDTGLRQEHLTHCRWLVRIPSRAANPAFNLSQAVLLSLFEVERALTPAQDARPSTEEVPQIRHERAAWREFYELDRIMDEALTRARFYHEGTPEPLPSVIKHLFKRIDPDVREMQLLLGMFSKINRALAGEVPVKWLPGQPGAPETGTWEQPASTRRRRRGTRRTAAP
jgi:TrmH family RNA methyltransferase